MSTLPEALRAHKYEICPQCHGEIRRRPGPRCRVRGELTRAYLYGCRCGERFFLVEWPVLSGCYVVGSHMPLPGDMETDVSLPLRGFVS
jgi:hypothetical protein